MQVIADSARTLEVLLPCVRASATVPVSALPPPEAALFARLGGGAEAVLAGPPPGAAARFFHRLFLVEEAPVSQFDVLRDHLSSGGVLPGPVATAARGGRGFHGHRGRSWSTVRGNLHLCAAFAPEGLPADAALGMVMLPALVAAEAIRDASGGSLDPLVKWVNDVTVGGRKVAGSLTTTQVDEAGLLAVVLGIGVNVEARPPVAPTPFVPAAACLRDYPCAADLTEADLLRAALEAFARLSSAAIAGGPGVLYPEYRRRSAVLGEEVRIYPEGGGDHAADPPLACGVVEDLRPDLSLLLRGRPESVDRGRLAFERDCRAFGR